MKKRALIIIPAYNEEDNIKDTVSNVKYMNNFDYIVVNDGSKDKTQEILDSNNFNHLDLPINLGIGGAMQTGYKYALKNDYDYAIQLDADGQHNPKDLAKLIDEIDINHFDMVIGSRFIEKTDYRGSLTRRVGIYYFYKLIHILTGKKVTDPTSGYRVVNKKIIKEFSNYYPQDYPEVEVVVDLAKKGYNIHETRVDMNSRQGGTSSITPLKSIYYMIKVTFFSVIRKVF
ncbi:glycosyltransferase family 2 protein [Priestia megaterium]|uniref:Glycosyl transferase 2 family protein n=1 Tax=Priestia megaterium (strain ATCC 14581 / DSM 32 / CCUG 1817 / JCM 2506 / NBRC 15308 / NCIMB 9376 / NCTC 10342 / NRRL B-14308 / VKM B-512 / Ford 19) TaxID=1348623 RepID=A0A0B6ADM3_PRIM2|nr:glycosyltransferase family 2 protein [Priestia megaterium]AJI23010.1 glycosyl transferase 2 family protein [Priestia megaterium NBRC 15308 = ATCC 14581]KFN06687.1 glycosyl transferase 2 family protein [Priestia megaterium]MED3806983.1 glycosyltransferase family 2 protein [Priestia megaterium]MED4395578.1 glycosyltransferase family 2 protein [Priestia megaterium]MED4736482.1 glycosyltransferase family 2 protein [Priestia megaterium]